MTLYGGNGNDSLDGGQGRDILYGGDGDDDLESSAQPGPENDILYGGSGNDLLISSDAGNLDILFGDEGDDRLFGGLSFGFSYGGNGNDLLYGGLQILIDGGSGNDVMYGGHGVDAGPQALASKRLWEGMATTRFRSAGTISIIRSTADREMTKSSGMLKAISW